MSETTPHGEKDQEAGTATQPTPSWHLIRALVGVAAVCGVLISTVFQCTLPTIEANRAEALREAVFAVIPGARRVVTFQDTTSGGLVPVEGKAPAGERLYGGYDAQGQLMGVAIEAQGKGYQDVIKLLYGYRPDEEKIVGFKILDSKETPGLGDKIGKDAAFLANFAALDVGLNPEGTTPRNALEVVKQGTRSKGWHIDAITGATISSKAVGSILNQSISQRLPGIQKNLATLREKP